MKIERLRNNFNYHYSNPTYIYNWPNIAFLRKPNAISIYWKFKKYLKDKTMYWLIKKLIKYLIVVNILLKQIDRVNNINNMKLIL